MEDGKSRSCGVASSSGGGWSGTAAALAKEDEATVAEMGGSFLSFLLSFSFSHSATTSRIKDGNSFDCCLGPLIEMCNKGFSKSFLILDRNLFFCHFRTLAPLSGQALLTGQLKKTSAMNDSMG